MNRSKLIDKLEAEEPLFNPEQGVRRLRDVKKSMYHSFRNGKARGETTHFKSIDPHFTWKKGEMIFATGYPGHGKTELVLNLMIAKSMHSGWKWVIFSPENYPVDEIYDTIIHGYIGKSVDPSYSNCMSEEDYEKGMDFVEKHFIAIEPHVDPTPEIILQYFEYVIKTDGVNGCFLDPWNQMMHDMPNREDQYLSNHFTKIKRFTQKHNQCFIIIAHAKTPMPGQDGNVPVPQAFSISGGSMWNNKGDIVMAVHRPEYFRDKKCNKVELHIHKVKKQKLVGIPGVIELTFDRRSNRYFEANGNSPLHSIEISSTYLQSFPNTTIEEVMPF